LRIIHGRLHGLALRPLMSMSALQLRLADLVTVHIIHLANL